MIDDPSTGSDDQARYGRRSRYRFTQVPHWVLLTAHLSDAGYRIYSLLLAHVNAGQEDGKTWPHQKTLADMLGRRREAVGRVIREELEPLGMVTVKEERYGTNDSRRRNVYYVHEVPPEGVSVYTSLTDWRMRNEEAAGQPGGAENRSSGNAENRSTGGAENRTCAGAENRSSGGAENRASSYTNEELDQRGTTHTPSAGAEGESASVSPEVVESLCKALASAIKNAGLKRPKITYAWRNAARDLLTPDEEGFAYSEQEILDGIAWAAADPFWRDKISTMAVFARNFPKMKLRAQGEQAGPKTEQAKADQKEATRVRMAMMTKFMAEFEQTHGRPMSEPETKMMMERLKKEFPG